MVLNGRFPHFPDHAIGNVYGRGESEIVMWMDDRTFEPARGHVASEEDLADFACLIESLRGTGLANLNEVHNAILAAGWDDRGMERYDARSGILIQHAMTLTDVAETLEDERTTILESSGGRHPDEFSPMWARWVDVTMQRGAAANASRAVALAAIEALLNELLAARHPDQYQRWEIDGKKHSFWKKLRALLRLLGIENEPAWVRGLVEHASLRDRMLHHRPEWVRDTRPQDSVEPAEELTHAALLETLDAVHAAIAGLFALYGAPVPDTHQPGFARGV